jgi:HEAT repeat protein
MRNSIFHAFFLATTMVVTFASHPLLLGQESAVATVSSEAELLEVLRGDAPGSDKAIACKRLAVFGSAAAVPDLAKLLSDEKFSSWSRIALEAIPGEEANEALRTAASQLQGRLLIGVINSLGVRRDVKAVELLAGKLKDAEPAVGASAAVALGNIGGEAASKVLRDALATTNSDVRSAVAEGCILCAEQLLKGGNASVAVELYDQVRKTELPKQRLVEATRGAILARGADGIPLLMEQLRSNDKAMFQLGLTAARELSVKEAVPALLAELNQADPEKAVLIVQALADRQGSIDLATILEVASTGPKPVRIAAINALRRMGDASCVEKLVAVGTDKDEDFRLPARTALVDIQDDGVNKKILALLPTASDNVKQLLVEVIGLRRMEATADLLKLLDSSVTSLRHASLESLGRTVPQEKLPVLIGQAIGSKNAQDAAVARQALQMAAVRMPDREACAAELVTAMSNAPVATKTQLLEILGAVGGKKALEAMAAAGKDADPQLKDMSTRLLGDWMTADAAPVLLDLASQGPLDKYQVRAMRGYIRIARQFVMSEEQRVAMCGKAWQAAKQPAEKLLVVEIMGRYPSLEMLKLAVEASKTPETKAEASKVAWAIAEKLGNTAAARGMLDQAGIAKP